ncbi:MAG TPA: UV DNA damage repair endonuclease UvsE [Bacilli bacterium]|nr:UV DNA damage repair endonuclease UvsE [Bacilli bacterium]
MEVRIGFVAMAVAVYGITPSSTFTYKLFSQRERKDAMARVVEVGGKNLQATQRILFYCAAHGIRLYRMSSSLIPLATHPDVELDVAATYAEELRRLGAFVQAQGIRVSMHPNQFTLLNGSEKVVTAALRDLEYHAAILDGMGVDGANKINIHIGGVYGDKEQALQKLYDNMHRVPAHVRARLTFENDDKAYTVAETLIACEQTGQPMMLDIHHDWCNPSPEAPLDYLPRIRATWRDTPMKMHVSSPKDDKDFRSHSDYIDPERLLLFLKGCKEQGMNRLDVMVEAKQKDLACLQLAADLAKVRGIKRVDGAVLEM